MVKKNKDQLTYVLIHGAWHSGAVWDGVAETLRSYGHEVHTPTLAGCGPDVTAEAMLVDAIDSAVDYIEAENLDNVVLVGWSFGGIIVSQVAARIPDRIARVVFNSAFVLKDGERLYDAIPAAMAEYFRDTTKSGLIELPFSTFRERFAPDIEAGAARDFYDAHLHPHVAAMFNTPVDMAHFNALVAEGLPVSWVNMPADVVLGFGRWHWSRFANRLAALGECRMIHLADTGHEAPLTNPEATARAYVQAARP